LVEPPSEPAIFAAINRLAESPDVVRTRLVNGKVTLIHRRLWPALVRLADRLPVERLAAIDEEHLPSGAHRVLEYPFPSWVPDDVAQLARGMSDDEAVSQLPSASLDRRPDADATSTLQHRPLPGLHSERRYRNGTRRRRTFVNRHWRETDTDR
jgi:hypothetical protein